MSRPTGWLFVLSVALCVWEPANLAMSASSDIGALAISQTGHPIFLMVRLLVASIGVAAGLAIWHRRERALTLAKIALTLSAAAGIARFGWFPGSVPPGMRVPLALVVLSYNAAWFAYLSRLKP